MGASLITISAQTPDNSLSMAEKHDLQFEVLSDVGKAVARQYKLVFTLADSFKTLMQEFGADLADYNGDASWELPIPGTFVIGQDGVIRLAYVDADYTHRIEPAAILDSLRTLGG